MKGVYIRIVHSEGRIPFLVVWLTTITGGEVRTREISLREEYQMNRPGTMGNSP